MKGVRSTMADADGGACPSRSSASWRKPRRGEAASAPRSQPAPSPRRLTPARDAVAALLAQPQGDSPAEQAALTGCLAGVWRLRCPRAREECWRCSPPAPGCCDEPRLVAPAVVLGLP